MGKKGRTLHLIKVIQISCVVYRDSDVVAAANDSVKVKIV